MIEAEEVNQIKVNLVAKYFQQSQNAKHGGGSMPY